MVVDRLLRMYFIGVIVAYLDEIFRTSNNNCFVIVRILDLNNRSSALAGTVSTLYQNSQQNPL